MLPVVNGHYTVTNMEAGIFSFSRNRNEVQCSTSWNLLGACEFKKVRNVAGVSCLERRDISGANVAFRAEIRSSPIERRVTVFDQKNVRKQSGVASVAVGKGMNGDKSM